MMYYLLYLMGLYEYDKPEAKTVIIESIKKSNEENKEKKEELKTCMIDKYYLVIQELKEKIRDKIILD